MKCRVEIDENVQKELNANLRKTSLIMLICGSIGLFLYIVLSVIFDDNVYLYTMLSVSSIFFGFGLVYLLAIKKTTQNQLRNKIVAEYEIFADYVVEKVIKNGEDFSTTKYYYKDFVKIKETQNYLFLYPNKFSALVIPKKEFSQKVFVALKSWIEKERNKKV